MMTSEILTTLISGVATLLVGVLVTLLNARLAKQRLQEKEKLDELLAASGAQAEAARADLIETLTEKLPEGLSAQEAIERLTKEYRIEGDVFVNQVAREGGGLVEDLVNGYHQQALSQARAQFWFSVAAATVGFVYILYAASGVEASSLEVFMRILPGVVIDAVAVLFFRQAEQTRQRATDLYDRLRRDNQMAMAQSTLEKIEDPRIRSLAQAQIALHLSGLDTKETDFSALLAQATS